jgi:hypothetical protein
MGDEAMILKRLFAAFSFNPITVVSAPLYNSMNYDQYNSVGYTQEVYNVPYLQINVPPASAISTPISVNDILNQTIYEFKNNTFVQRQRRIHSADEVIAITLSRKFKTPQIPNNGAMPFYAALPLSISGYETINQSPVDCVDSFVVGDNDDAYVLRSAVFAEMILPVSLSASGVPATGRDEVVVGSSAMVKRGGEWLAFRPVLIHSGGIYASQNQPNTPFNSPIIQLQSGLTDANGNLDVDADPNTILSKRGLVLIYQKGSAITLA